MKWVSALVGLVGLFRHGDAARPTVRTIHPESMPKARSYEDALPPSLIDLLIDDAHAMAEYVKTFPSMTHGKYSTFWMPAGKTPRTAMEEAVRRLYPLAEAGDKNVGGEYWVQKVEAGEKGSIGFHVDKDESIASNQHYLAHPEHSSILYLTDTGGPTLVLDQFSPHGNGYVPEIPKRGFLSSPKRNKYTLFHGDLLHGVLGGTDIQGAKRITFLINFWDNRPEPPNCQRMKYKEAEKSGVTLYSKKEMKALQKRLDAELQESGEEPSVMELGHMNLRPKSTERETTNSYRYRVALPGNQQEFVQLPDLKSVEEGSTVELQWRKYKKRRRGTKTKKKKKKGKKGKKKDRKPVKVGTFQEEQEAEPLVASKPEAVEQVREVLSKYGSSGKKKAGKDEL